MKDNIVIKNYQRYVRLIRPLLVAALLALALPVLAACGGGDPTLTVYSGRFDSLIAPLVYSFSVQTGIEVNVTYSSNDAIVVKLLEEGADTPADVVLLHETIGLARLSQASIFSTLPQELLGKVDPQFRSSSDDWVGTGGRAHTIVYNVAGIDPEQDLPDSIAGFVDPAWNGRVGWAPGDDSFHALVTAFRVQQGEAAARRWLEGMKANNPRQYTTNTAIVTGAAYGEVDVGIVSHYYLQRFLESEGPAFGARTHFMRRGDPGALVLVAGAGIPNGAVEKELAVRFIEYLLSASGQRYFASQANEFPLVAGIPPEGDLPPLQSLAPPDVDLNSLTDLQGTLALLREVGILP